MCIKKSHVGQRNLTNHGTDLAVQHLKCCFGHSEMLKPKSVVSISVKLSYTTVLPNSRHPPPKAMTAFIVLHLLEAQVIYYI